MVESWACGLPTRKMGSWSFQSISIRTKYDHLDCIWSTDCIERIGNKIVEDIWYTTTAGDVVVPTGCRPEDKGKYLKWNDDPEK